MHPEPGQPTPEECPFDVTPTGGLHLPGPDHSPAGPLFQLREKLRSNLPVKRLLRELHLPVPDVLLIGDGSGSGAWTMGAGWACAVIDYHTNQREIICGGWSIGSVMIAELSAYMHGLMTYESRFGDVTRFRLGRPAIVQVLTDNQGIVMQHPVAFSGRTVRGDCIPIWAALRELCRTGSYVMNFKHVPRLSIMLNHVCDRLALKSRESVQGLPSEQSLRETFGEGVEDWNQ